MPALKNARWERFAQLIAEGLGNGSTQAKAYEVAGYATKGHSSEAAASRLLRNVEPVIRRVQELHAETARRKQVTRDSIVDELDSARAIAERNEQASAMVQATSVKAKVCGLFVEKIEQGQPGDFEMVKTKSELAEKYLTEAGACQITEEMRKATLEELERHVAIIHAIATGTSSSHH